MIAGLVLYALHGKSIKALLWALKVLLRSCSGSLGLQLVQSMGTAKPGERKETHKQRRALRDRKLQTEKDTQRLKRDLEP